MTRQLKTIFILTIYLFSFCDLNAQKDSVITNKNYYDYQLDKNKLSFSTNWIRKNEVLDTLYKYLDRNKLTYTRTGTIPADKKTTLPIDGYLPDLKIGFYIEPGHSGTISKTSRINKNIEYYEYDKNGTSYISHSNLYPDNILILKEDFYWFQSLVSKKDIGKVKDSLLVTKKVAFKILQQDIDNYFGQYLKK